MRARSWRPWCAPPFVVQGPQPLLQHDARLSLALARAAKCWEKDSKRSLAFLALDVGIVFGLAGLAMAINQWWSWPIYWFAQGTMFWALFVVGHDW